MLWKPWKGSVAALLAALALILWASLGRAAPTELTCTAPTGSKNVWMVFDPDVGDSVQQVECSGGPALHDSMWVVLYWQRLSGGPPTPQDSARVSPGDSVKFNIPGPGHLYATARNSAGTSCVTGIVYVPPSDPTGVPVEESAERVLTCALFDVQGRRVAWLPGSVWYEMRGRTVIGRDLLARGVTLGRLARGVYFMKGRTLAGRWTAGARRVVVVR